MNGEVAVISDRPILWTTVETIASTQSSYLIAIMSWKEDVVYAMTPIKLLTIPLGGWPLQEYNKFALTRYAVSAVGLVYF